jgi:hypothetical protein
MPFLAGITLLFAFALPASAGKYMVSIGGETSTEISPFTTNKTYSQLYNYKDSQYNGDVALPIGGSTYDKSSFVFLIDSSVEDGIGVFIVNWDNNTTRMHDAGVDFQGIFAVDTTQVVSDEPNSDPYDSYTVTSSSSTDTYAVHWYWYEGKTDGMALSWTPQDAVADAVLSFTNTGDDGFPLKNWVVLENDGSNGTSIANTGSLVGQSLQITLVPLPPAAWPVVGMLGALAIRRRFSKHISRKDCE